MTTTEPAPMMFRISTVVKLTGLSRSVIYEQIKAGRLRAVKQGTATLITAAASSARAWPPGGSSTSSPAARGTATVTR